MTDHLAAALETFAAAEAIPGETTRTDLLLKALFHATLAPKAAPAELVIHTAPATQTAPVADAKPSGGAELLLFIIRREGGIWDGKKAGAAYIVAGGELPARRASTDWARDQLMFLAEAGYLVKTGTKYSLPPTTDNP